MQKVDYLTEDTFMLVIINLLFLTDNLILHYLLLKLYKK